MKLVNYLTGDEYRLGIVTEHGIINVGEVAQALGQDDLPCTMEEAVKQGNEIVEPLKILLEKAKLQNYSFSYTSEAEVTFGPCVPRPGKIICVGLNYKKHAEETNSPIPEYPVLFNKFDNTIKAHLDVIELPLSAKQVDYEAELAIVIGHKAKHALQQEALEYVLGYCNANDLSARDLQTRTSQWALGKSPDDFAPIGPYLVTADEVGDPNQLNISCRVNGEIRQQSNTRDMIFSCKEIITYVTEFITLNPGDMILTGTPEGVIVGYPPEKRVWLESGDTVTVEIEKLGILTNKLVRN